MRPFYRLYFIYVCNIHSHLLYHLTYLIHIKINKYIKHKLTLLPINHHLNTYND